jgi:hypothetical protein
MCLSVNHCFSALFFVASGHITLQIIKNSFAIWILQTSVQRGLFKLQSHFLTRYGGTYLKSQHSGSWERRMATVKPARATEQNILRKLWGPLQALVLLVSRAVYLSHKGCGWQVQVQNTFAVLLHKSLQLFYTAFLSWTRSDESSWVIRLWWGLTKARIKNLEQCLAHRHTWKSVHISHCYQVCFTLTVPWTLH